MGALELDPYEITRRASGDTWSANVRQLGSLDTLDYTGWCSLANLHSHWSLGQLGSHWIILGGIF